jgi:hypothetical protein
MMVASDQQHWPPQQSAPQVPEAQSPQQVPVQLSQQTQVVAARSVVAILVVCAMVGSAKTSRQRASCNFDFIFVSSEFLVRKSVRAAAGHRRKNAGRQRAQKRGSTPFVRSGLKS